MFRPDREQSSAEMTAIEPKGNRDRGVDLDSCFVERRHDRSTSSRVWIVFAIMEHGGTQVKRAKLPVRAVGNGHRAFRVDVSAPDHPDRTLPEIQPVQSARFASHG